MKICVHVVNINNYQPEICALTLPNLRAYAKRIGADFNLITKPFFSTIGFTPNFEKFQVYADGMGYDMNVVLDADFLLAPDFPDVTALVPWEAVASYMIYGAHVYFKKLDRYFLRDQRDLAIVTNFVVTTGLTHDAWEPPGVLESAKALSECVENKWCVDEYVFSRNVAKYGLKYSGLITCEQDNKKLLHLDLTTLKNEGRDPLAAAKQFLANFPD